MDSLLTTADHLLSDRRPAILDEIDKVEKMPLYATYGNILAGMHAVLRQKYGEDSQAIASKTDSSTNSSL
jgi:hypothetical protein